MVQPTQSLPARQFAQASGHGRSRARRWRRALAPSVLVGVSDVEPGVLEVAPTTDPLALILERLRDGREREGSLLVLVPTESWAQRLRGRLEQRGCAVASGESQWDRMRAGWPVVVGARAARRSPPCREVSGAVILDADDESYRSQGAPTWDAVTMLRERCRRDEAPLWCTSSVPVTGATQRRAASPVGTDE